MEKTRENLVRVGAEVCEIRTDIPFAQALRKVDLPVWNGQSQIKLKIPRIPYPLFRQIVAWQRKIAMAHSCETATSLFLINGEWIAESFYQNNHHGSMDADVDFKEERNAKLLEGYADASEVHATLHNHVRGMASQSSRDSNDEKNLPGPHITIGNLHELKLSFHARLSTYVDGKHEFLSLRFSDIIDIPMPPAKLKDETITEIENAYLTFKSEDDEIPKEWADRFEIKQRQTYGHQHHQQSAGSGAPAENLEQFIERNKASLTPWPYGFLAGIDVTDKKKFKKSMDELSVIQMHAALAVTSVLGDDADYNDLYEHLRERRFNTNKTEPPKAELKVVS